MNNMAYKKGTTENPQGSKSKRKMKARQHPPKPIFQLIMKNGK